MKNFEGSPADPDPARETQPKRPYRMKARQKAVDETRERILQVTYQLWLEHHYDELTLAAVADAADVTRQTVHRHFGSKEELMVAVGEWRAPREDAARQVAVGDIEAAVRLVVDRNEEMGDANVRALELEGRVAIIDQMLERGRDAHRAWIERVFAPFLAELDGPARDSVVMALYAATDVTVWKLLRRDFGRSRPDTEAIIRRLVEGVLDPLRDASGEEVT